MPTARKKEAVKELQELFTSSPVLIFTDYRGLSVSDITNLRRQLREKGVEYHVTKNTLTTLAADKAGLGDMGTLLDGPTAIAFVGDDIQGAAKVLTDFVRTSRILQIRGGFMGHAMISADQVGDLTRLLTREQYIARMLGSMQSPISGMVGALAGVIRNFMNVMQARVDQLKEQGEPEAEAPVEAPAGVSAVPSPNGVAPAASPEAMIATPVASVVEPAAPVAEPTASVVEPTASVVEPTASVVEPTAAQEAVAEAPTVTPAEEATPVASMPEPAPAAPEAAVAQAPAEAPAEAAPVASIVEPAAPTEPIAETPAEAPTEEVAPPTEVEAPDAGKGEESA